MSWVVVAARGPKSDADGSSPYGSSLVLAAAFESYSASNASAWLCRPAGGAVYYGPGTPAPGRRVRAYRRTLFSEIASVASASGVREATDDAGLAGAVRQATTEGADRIAVVERLQAGSRYPADLGRVRGSFSEHFFVGSVAASRMVRMWWLMRPDPIRIETRRCLRRG
ncbi:MAG: hypothetical protein V3V29_01045 [Acidimicrobiia bacterium]